MKKLLFLILRVEYRIYEILDGERSRLHWISYRRAELDKLALLARIHRIEG